jgi:hypothetical protein
MKLLRVWYWLEVSAVLAGGLWAVAVAWPGVQALVSGWAELQQILQALRPVL